MKLVSERKESELELEEDFNDISSVNTQSFVDEQEWELYKYIEVKKGIIDTFLQGSIGTHPSISYTCRASRRYGFYVWNIYVVMVRD